MTIPTWTLQDRIRKAREYAQLNQAALAELIPVARNTLSRWESGAYKPSPSDLDRLAEITAVDRNWLETGAEPAPTGALPSRLTVEWTPEGLHMTQQGEGENGSAG